MKHNLKKLLQKCIAEDVDYVLTSEGFINNCNLSDSEIYILQTLAEELKNTNKVIVFNSIACTPYITSYNGGYILAGIKFNKVEEW